MHGRDIHVSIHPFICCFFLEPLGGKMNQLSVYLGRNMSNICSNNDQLSSHVTCNIVICFPKHFFVCVCHTTCIYS